MTDMAMTEAAAGEPAQARIEAVAAELLAKMARAQRASDEDPFGNPVLSVALGIARRIDDGQLDDESLWALVRHLRDAAFAGRARRLARYVGGTDRAENEAALMRVAGVVLRPDPSDSPVRWAEFREAVERTRYAAVFTAHPTFALPAEVARALAAMACGGPAESSPRTGHSVSLWKKSSPRPAPPSPAGGMRWTSSMPPCWRRRADPGRTAGPNWHPAR